MKSSIDVQSQVTDATLVVMLSYTSDVLLSSQSAQELTTRLLSAYTDRNTSEVGPSCIVEIRASVASSSLIRALFELWKSVIASSGELRIVGYPPEYTDSLTSLGITTLKGFRQSSSREEALKSLRS